MRYAIARMKVSRLRSIVERRAPPTSTYHLDLPEANPASKAPLPRAKNARARPHHKACLTERGTHYAALQGIRLANRRARLPSVP